MNDAASQNRAILAWLTAGNSLTPAEALSKFGCFRVAARIYDLKEMGHDIQTVWETKGKKRYARYVIVTDRVRAIMQTPPFAPEPKAEAKQPDGLF